MQIIRKFFGWFFGFVALLCLGIFILQLRSGLIAGHGTLHRSSIVAAAVLVSMAIVFAMAWWTTWKDRPSARAWGITASLVNMLGPVSLMYFLHRHLTDSRWKVIAASTLALIAYAWPNRETESPLEHPIAEHDSAHE